MKNAKKIIGVIATVLCINLAFFIGIGATQVSNAEKKQKELCENTQLELNNIVNDIPEKTAGVTRIFMETVSQSADVVMEYIDDWSEEE